MFCHTFITPDPGTEIIPRCLATRFITPGPGGNYPAMLCHTFITPGPGAEMLPLCFATRFIPPGPGDARPKLSRRMFPQRRRASRPPPCSSVATPAWVECLPHRHYNKQGSPVSPAPLVRGAHITPGIAWARLHNGARCHAAGSRPDYGPYSPGVGEECLDGEQRCQTSRL